MKVKNSIQLFLEHCQFEKLLNEKTIEAYKTDLFQFYSFLNQQKINQLEQINKHTIKAYVKHLQPFEIRTIKRKIASTKAYLNFLEFEDYILVNPFRKVKLRLREAKQLPTVLDLEEVRRILLLIKQQLQNADNKTSYFFGEKLRDLTIIELLFATGLRVSELCGILPSDINLKTGAILIRGKGNKERMIQVCNMETINTLNAYYSFHKSRIHSAGFFLSPD